MVQKRVLVFGATSRVGPEIVKALLSSSNSFETTLLLRPSSSTPPSYPGAKHLTLPSDNPTFEQLVDTLKGYDVLVAALGRQTFDLQKTLADVCVAAQVSRYILADYGSVSSEDEVARQYLDLYRQKAAVREYAAKVADKNTGFTWTSLITGHFFDYGLKTELLGFNLEKKEVDLFDGGKIRWSSSTLPQIGKSVVKVLLPENEEKTANKLLYVQSFCHSQLDIVNSVEKALGGKTSLKRHEISSEKWLADRKQKAKEGDADAIEEVVEVLGMTRSNWIDGGGQEGYANDLLGLKEEDLDQVVKQVVDELKKKAKQSGSYCVIC